MSFKRLLTVSIAYLILQLVDTERSELQNLLHRQRHRPRTVGHANQNEMSREMSRENQWEPYPQNISPRCHQIAIENTHDDYYSRIATEKKKLDLPVSFLKDILGCQLEWFSDMTEAEKGETDSNLRCSSKVFDKVIRLQQTTNDKCHGKDGDYNLEAAMKRCCEDHSVGYCTGTYQLRKFNGGIPSEGERRVCLEEKDGKSLVLMARTFNNSSPYWEYFARNLAAYAIGACHALVELTGKACPKFFMVEGYQHQLPLRENLSFVVLNALNPDFEQVWPMIRDYPVNSKWLIISEFDYLRPHFNNYSIVGVALPEHYDEHKGKSLCMSDVYKTFVTTEYAFRCKGVVSLHVDLKKTVKDCCENGGGDECVVEKIMNNQLRASKHAISSGCDRVPIKELYSAEPDQFLVQFIPKLCGYCFCEGQLSVLWDNPELFATNTTLRDVFMNLNLGRQQDLHDIVRLSMKNSPGYEFKPHDRSNVLTNIGERRPLLTCYKPDNSAQV